MRVRPSQPECPASQSHFEHLSDSALADILSLSDHSSEADHDNAWCVRSITYDVGSKDESFEWMNVHRAPPTLVRPATCLRHTTAAARAWLEVDVGFGAPARHFGCVQKVLHPWHP